MLSPVSWCWFRNSRRVDHCGEGRFGSTNHETSPSGAERFGVLHGGDHIGLTLDRNGSLVNQSEHGRWVCSKCPSQVRGDLIGPSSRSNFEKNHFVSTSTHSDLREFPDIRKSVAHAIEFGQQEEWELFYDSRSFPSVVASRAGSLSSSSGGPPSRNRRVDWSMARAGAERSTKSRRFRSD